MCTIDQKLSTFRNEINALGPAGIPTPNRVKNYVRDDEKELYLTDLKTVSRLYEEGKVLPAFEKAGPRELIYFSPPEIRAGIVTCGGLCPGLNDVIRSIVMSLNYQYQVKSVLGYRFGYMGLSQKPPEPPMQLSPGLVLDIHNLGGTILGTSRGAPKVKTIVDTLEKDRINLFFAIGGDGTLRGAHEIAEECLARQNNISIVGIPKTIDNDIDYISKTFGFMTAVEQATETLTAIHNEVYSLSDGVGIVKLMGRDSGFIAANACLSNNNANVCLIPEVDFDLNGEHGLLEYIRERLIKRHHIVIVLAEGAGQKYFNDKQKKVDRSGNIKHGDIGLFLKNQIQKYSRSIRFPMTIKYIDPSYQIRSHAANAADSAFCLALGQNAVHAAMAGKTDLVVSEWNNHFIHVPISMAVSSRKKVNPDGKIWQRVCSTTGQPSLLQR